MCASVRALTGGVDAEFRMAGKEARKCIVGAYVLASDDIDAHRYRQVGLTSRLHIGQDMASPQDHHRTWRHM